ncbi:hypothetical protein BDW22DRAFT_1421138 [Trametopsis cervina]|nr:hypothetical protein BDW22DRAFT_1421138 [Trametopsis cervina]
MGKQNNTEIETRKMAIESLANLRDIQVIMWYKVDGPPLIADEKVPFVFSISDLTELCTELGIDTKGDEQLGVWCPEEFDWKPFVPRAEISYAEEHKAILIRREGAKHLQDFWERGYEVFA